MRRILRKIAEDDFGALGDTSTLADPAVWEAARHLVDYSGMTDSFLAGQMEIHQAFWPKGFPGALEDTPFSYDPAKAEQILADAGVELPITVELDVINAAPFTDMAQSLQATFRFLPSSSSTHPFQHR